jgi:hypothetical protein
MFQILRNPFTAPCSKMFKEDVGHSIQPNYEALDELSRWHHCLPAHLGFGGLDIPTPAKLGKPSCISPKRQASIPEKDPPFYEMCEAVENVD